MKKILFIILTSVLLTSCENFFDVTVPIEVEPHESKIAPSALLGNSNSIYPSEQYNYIYLSKTKGALDNSKEPTHISQATITLTSGNEMITYSESQDNTGLYFPNQNINLIPGNDYHLKVEKNGFNTVTATQKYPKPIPVISASVDGEILKVKFQDLTNQQDYYYLELFQINDTNRNPCPLESFSSNSIRSKIVSHGLIINDETFDGQTHEFKAKYSAYLPTDEYKFLVLLHHITKDFYRFDKSLGMNYDVKDNPFAEPVIMYTNIENGYGIFGLRNTSEYIIE